VLEDETGLAEEAAMAMRELARTVTEAPPLRLAPRRAARAARAARPRRLALWAMPLTAAVVVIALAIALVTIRNLSNGGESQPAVPASPPVPTYYVAPVPVCTTCGSTPARLVVGDTFTGATLATFSPPAGTTFGTVSAAANDRTFVTDTVGFPSSSTTQHVTWYLVTVRPGASSPARLTRLPIPATPSAAHLEMVALSPSGRELAVAYHLGSKTPGSTVLRTYSMATGALLHGWSTEQNVWFESYGYLPGPQASNQLGWIDGDRGITFTTFSPIQNGNQNPAKDKRYTTVRVLDAAAGDGDLLGASLVVWSTPFLPATDSTTKPDCDKGTTAPSLAANGKTVLCTSVATSQIGVSGKYPLERWWLTWLTYKASAPKAARTAYQVSFDVNGRQNGGIGINVLWADASGATMIIAWTTDSNDYQATHFGVVSHGRFTPLPSPPVSPLNESPNIAW
jgi:hypothetical protein